MKDNVLVPAASEGRERLPQKRLKTNGEITVNGLLVRYVLDEGRTFVVDGGSGPFADIGLDGRHFEDSDPQLQPHEIARVPVSAPTPAAEEDGFEAWNSTEATYCSDGWLKEMITKERRAAWNAREALIRTLTAERDAGVKRIAELERDLADGSTALHHATGNEARLLEEVRDGRERGNYLLHLQSRILNKQPVRDLSEATESLRSWCHPSPSVPTKEAQ